MSDLTPIPYVADEAEAIAKLYRRLVVLIGLQIVLGIGAQVLQLSLVGVSSERPGTGTLLAFGLVVIGALVALIAVGALTVVAAYRLAARLEAGVPVLWAVGMLIPCINVLVLLALSATAQRWCRRQGVKVGLLGPTQESIEELRRRSASSVFE